MLNTLLRLSVAFACRDRGSRPHPFAWTIGLKQLQPGPIVAAERSIKISAVENGSVWYARRYRKRNCILPHNDAGSLMSLSSLTVNMAMGVRRNFSWRQRRQFVYSFQVANDAVQMDVHKILHSLYIYYQNGHCCGRIHKTCASLAATGRSIAIICTCVFQPAFREWLPGDSPKHRNKT